MRNFLYNFIYLIILFWITGCEAPHENPLDPENPDYGYFKISGVITELQANNSPVQKAEIVWQAESIIKETDSNGKFEILCNKNINGWLLISKEGFTSDSVYIDWKNDKVITVQKRLDAIPVLNSLSFYSIVKNKYSKAENLLTFEISVTDSDDDIDSIKIKCSDLGINVSLQKQTSKNFSGTFSDADLGLVNFDDVIGKSFEVLAKSGDGTEYYLGKSFIARIIKNQIEVISPINSDTVTNTISLKWKRLTPGFNFRYLVEVYTNETEPKLLWSKDSISSEEISIDVDTEITPTADNDQFFWVIWCIDEFNNRSRSKPAGFIVKSLK